MRDEKRRYAPLSGSRLHPPSIPPPARLDEEELTYSIVLEEPLKGIIVLFSTAIPETSGAVTANTGFLILGRCHQGPGDGFLPVTAQRAGFTPFGHGEGYTLINKNEWTNPTTKPSFQDTAALFLLNSVIMYDLYTLVSLLCFHIKSTFPISLQTLLVMANPFAESSVISLQPYILFLQSSMLLDKSRGQQTLSVKGQRGNVLGSAGHLVLVATVSLLL